MGSVLRNCFKLNFLRSSSFIIRPIKKHLSVGADNSDLWVTSRYSDQKYPEDAEAHEILFEKIPQYGNLPALTCGTTGRTFTFSQIYNASRSFATALLQAGFSKGDVAAVVLPNIPEYSVVVLGCWAAGLTVSGVNPAYTPQEIQRQILHSSAKLAITSPSYLSAVETVKQSASLLSNIIVVDPDNAYSDTYSFQEMVKVEPLPLSSFSSGSKSHTKESVSLLPFSSGTTGLPKGVMLTHANTVINMFQFLHQDVCPTYSLESLGHQERLIAVLPLFHMYGFTVFITTGLFQGSHTLLLPRFNPETFRQAVSSNRPTCLHLVTPLISHIASSAHYTPDLLSSLHTVVGGAAPIGTRLINKLLEKGNNLFFAEGYGMTELSPMSHFLDRKSENKKGGSCGRPIPDTWTKIVDPLTGRTLGAQEKGEIWVKGPQVMKGYWKNEKATMETITADGWLKTGDIGYYDEDSYFYVVDRLKELIKVKGFQVAPSELEDLLRQHEKIRDCAVIGVEDVECGEVPRAYVVGDVQEDEVKEWVSGQVARFKWLQGGVEIVEMIPKSPSGKILRRELLAEYKRKQ